MSVHKTFCYRQRKPRRHNAIQEVFAMAKLSVAECRKELVGLEEHLTDKQIEQIRDNLTMIVNTLLKGVINGKQ